jgi:hypothetical protein
MSEVRSLPQCLFRIQSVGQNRLTGVNSWPIASFRCFIELRFRSKASHCEGAGQHHSEEFLLRADKVIE